VADAAHVFSEAGVYTVTRTVTTAQGCTATAAMEVEVVLSPVLDVTPSITLGCSPVEVVWEQQSLGVGGEWDWTSSAAGWSASGPDPGGVVIEAAGGEVTEESITVTWTHPCATLSQTWEITALPLPAVDLEWAEDTLCAPAVPEPLVVVNGGATEWNWTWNGISSGWTPVSVAPEVPAWEVSGSAPWQASVSVMNSCGTATDAADFWVETTDAVAGWEASTLEGCAPLEVTWNFTGSGADEVTFYTADWSASGNTVVHTWEEAGVQEVFIVAADACGSDTVSTWLTVFGEPVFALEVSDTLLCVGQTLSLTLTAQDLSSVAWDFDNGSTAAGTSAETVFNEAGSYLVSVETEFGSPGCAASGTVPVHVFDYPQITGMPELSIGCSPLQVAIDPGVLVGLNPLTGQLDWSGTWTVLQTGASSSGPQFSAELPALSPSVPTVYTVQLVASSGPGCLASESWNFEVLPLPVASFEPVPLAGTAADPDPYNTIWHFENASTGATGFFWDLGDGSTSSDAQPSHEYAAGTYEVTLTAIAASGCSAETTRTLEVIDANSVFVPNAFTPGARMDGVNDGFRPVLSHPDRFTAPGSYHFEVFNRWGIRVFQSHDPEEYWIGESLSGTHFAQDDLYTWQLTLQWNRVERKVFQGSVLLLRE
jgi:PKD repeat protein